MKSLSLFVLVCASQASALTLSLNDIPAQVRGHHPSLKAARLAVEEARGRLLGAGRRSNPIIGTDVQNESQVSPGAVGFSVEQSFPLTDRLKLEKKLSAQHVEAAQLEVLDAERKLIAEAQTVAVKLIALEQQKALRTRQVELTQKLADFIKGRAAAGELSPLDAAQTKLDAQRLQLEGKRLINEGIALTGELRPLLGIGADEPLRITGTLAEPALPAINSWQQRPDYVLALKKVEASATDIDLAKSKRLGDLTAGLFTAREWQQGESTGYVGIKLSVPWSLWNKNEGEIAEKTASATRADLEAKALAASITAVAKSARAEMEAAMNLIKETKEQMLPLLNEHASNVEKAYQKAQSDLVALQRAREQTLQTEATMLDALRDFHLARIRYEAATGQHCPATSK